MDYSRGSHVKHYQLAHIIFVCKYRKPMLDCLGDFVKSQFYYISNRYNTEIITMEVDKDHIHMLLRYGPNQSISNLVKLYKQISTYNIWIHYKDYLRKYFWKRKIFWSSGYFISTIGQVSSNTIQNYIKQQG